MTTYRRILFFILFTLLFLFYPGDSPYIRISAYNRVQLQVPQQYTQLKIPIIPIVQPLYFPSLSAQGIYVVHHNSFTPLLEYNGKILFLPASTVKIITALTAYEIFNPDDVITVKRTITEGQVMGLIQGEEITFENLLYGMLVHSGNDAAYAIADAYGYDAFIKRMNIKVKQLQMTQTKVGNPAGLEDKEQYTTPFDLALAARELLKNKYLSKIVSTKEITISDVDYLYFHRLVNVNKLLGEIQGIGGLKTGYTENAGENLVSFYKKNNHEFIIVLLKSEDRFEDTRAIVQWIDASIYFSNK